jgi:hypothetical protein
LGFHNKTLTLGARNRARRRDDLTLPVGEGNMHLSHLTVSGFSQTCSPLHAGAGRQQLQRRPVQVHATAVAEETTQQVPRKTNKIAESVTDVIGNTPMVYLNKVPSLLRRNWPAHGISACSSISIPFYHTVIQSYICFSVCYRFVEGLLAGNTSFRWSKYETLVC